MERAEIWVDHFFEEQIADLKSEYQIELLLRGSTERAPDASDVEEVRKTFEEKWHELMEQRRQAIRRNISSNNDNASFRAENRIGGLLYYKDNPAGRRMYEYWRDAAQEMIANQAR
jgi:hypothetical protein